MEKVLFCLLVFIPILCNAQDDLYYFHGNTQISDTISKNNVEQIQFYLSKYHSERSIAFTLTSVAIFGSFTTAGLCYSDKKDIAVYTGIASCILYLSGFTVFWDSDKWLKKASVKITPTSLKINLQF